MMHRRAISLRGPLYAGLLVVLASCQSSGPSGPEGNRSQLSASAARLTLSVDELTAEPRRNRFASADARYVEETAQWGGDDPERPSAGLRLSEASPGPPLSDPREPSAIVGQWTVLQDKRPAFTEPGSAENAYGPVSWWRAGLGTSSCVLFVQRLPEQGKTAATLSGFFCNPPGLPLSPQAAVTVVQRIGLRAAPKTP